MRRRMLGAARWFFVTGGVVLLTSFTVDATLTNSISQSALGIFATSLTDSGGCPAGMVRLQGDYRNVCIDAYEASPNAYCPKPKVSNNTDTLLNFEERACAPETKANAAPWTFVTLHQARELCGKAGKRLPSNEEWYEAGLGTVDTKSSPACVTSGRDAEVTGKAEDCVSGVGAYDMIGNVWEWIDAEAQNGMYEGRELPPSGYVTNADAAGVATLTDAESADQNYHEDYFWSDTGETFGMLRGGFFGSGSDAGLYSIQAKTPSSFTGAAIGFRCAQDASS